MRIYIAGPMTGLPEFNYPAFIEAESRLRALGYEVESPHHNGDGDTTRPWQWYMRAGIAQLLTCDAVALLPAWQKSRGACMEVTIADALDMDVQTIDVWEQRAEMVA